MGGQRGDPLALEYEVLTGGNLDIDVTLENQDAKVLYQETRQTHGDVFFEEMESTGEYTACFSNKMSLIESKVVYIKWSMGPDMEDVLAEADTSQMDPRYATVIYDTMSLRAAFIKLSETLQRARNSDFQHKRIAEQLNSGVQMWSICMTVGIIVVSLFQVYYLKGYFRDRDGDSRT